MKHATRKTGRQLLDDPNLPDHEWTIPIGVHLMRRCRKCIEAVHTAFARWAHTKPDDPRVALVAFEFLYRQGVSEETLNQQARRDADELLELSPSEQESRLGGEPRRFRSPALVDELIKRCEKYLTLDREGALHLAKLAVEISLRTEPDVVGSLAFHARARAAAHYGNCLRLRDQPHAAEQAFQRADEHYLKAPLREPKIVAELQRLKASLAIDKRQFDEANAHLAQAMEFFRRSDDKRSLGLVLLKRAHAAYQRGEPGEGLDDLCGAATLLDPVKDQRHYPMICFNLVLYAVEAGDIKLARSYYQKHANLLESRSEPWFALRLLWLQAKMARAEGDPQTARDFYDRAREGFLAEIFGYDAALVSLELALLELELGDNNAVQRLAAEMLPIFKSQDVHREALAALALFQQAALTDELTLELGVQLLRYLQLARSDTSLKFHEFQADLYG